MIINDKILSKQKPSKLNSVEARQEKLIYGYPVSWWNMAFGKEPTILEVELFCYQLHVQKKLDKMLRYPREFKRSDHLKRAFLEYQRVSEPKWDVKKNWHIGMDYMIKAFCDEHPSENIEGPFPYVAIPAASNLSKTWFCSRLACLHFISNPTKTLVYLTTTDAQGLDQKLWGDVVKFMKQFPAIESQMKLKDSNQDRSYSFGDTKKAGIKAWAVAKGEKTAGKFQGGRGEASTVVIIDEAELTEKAIFQAATSNLMMGGGHFKLMMLGNPNDTSREFATWYEPAGGFGNDVPRSGVYISKRGALCIQFDCLRMNPNYLMEPNLEVDIPIEKQFSFLQTRQNMLAIIRTFGLNSTTWWQMVRGWPAPDSEGRRLIARSAIANAENKPVFDFLPGTVHHGAAMDTAWDGGDRCVWLPYDVGYAMFDLVDIITKKVVKAKLPAIQLGEPVYIKTEASITNPVAYQIAERCVELNKLNEVEPIFFGMDSTNGDINAIIQKSWNMDIYSIDYNQPCSDRQLRETDNRTAKELCEKFVTELWVATGIWCAEGQLRGLSEVASRELGSREKVTKPSGKICAETKKEMKKRLKESPDEADAVTIVTDIVRRNGYIACGKMTGAGTQVNRASDPFARLLRASRRLWRPTWSGEHQQ